MGYNRQRRFIPYRHFFANGPVVVNGTGFCRLRLDHLVEQWDEVSAPKGSDSQLYIPSSPPFSTPELVICEGEFKSLALRESGVRAVAINGINAGVLSRRAAAFARESGEKGFFHQTDLLLWVMAIPRSNGDSSSKRSNSRAFLNVFSPSAQLLLPRVPLFAIRDNGADGGEAFMIPNGIDDLRQSLSGDFGTTSGRASRDLLSRCRSKNGCERARAQVAERTLSDITIALEPKKYLLQTGLLEMASHL